MDNGNNKGREFNQGIIVLFALGVLTAIEYFLGVTQVEGSATISLSVIALIKAGIIVQYFMHVGRVGGSEGGH